MDNKQILPNEAIEKAYEELIEKDKLIADNKNKLWKDNNEDECPICYHDFENRDGKCYCNATNFPPCGFCECEMPECFHTNGEVEDFIKENN